LGLLGGGEGEGGKGEEKKKVGYVGTLPKALKEKIRANALLLGIRLIGDRKRRGKGGDIIFYVQLRGSFNRKNGKGWKRIRPNVGLVGSAAILRGEEKKTP